MKKFRGLGQVPYPKKFRSMQYQKREHTMKIKTRAGIRGRVDGAWELVVALRLGPGRRINK